MKLARIARNLILARIAWRYIARRRALARRRRARRAMVPVLIAGGAGILWTARRRILAGAQDGVEVATPAGERSSGAGPSEGPQHGLRKPEQVEPPTRGDGKAATRATSALGASGYRQPAPGPKKHRKRARRQGAEEREKAERQSAQGGKVNVEVNETSELRAPLGDLKH